MKGNRICKELLLKTLDISNVQFSRVATKKSESDKSPRDKRGQSTPKNKIPEYQIQFVKKHIESIPKYVSHYSRIHCPQKFLPESLNISIKFNLYMSVCEDWNESPVKEWAYRHIFNNHARAVTLATNVTGNKKGKKFLHLRKAERARQQKKADTERASTWTGTIVIVFDLQKTLPTPRVSTNKVYYLRQLWTYNCGIHNIVTVKAHMFMWDKITAKRGSQEEGSCLVKYFNSLDDKIKHVIAYTDCCTG
ncbi:hypothetical protein PR048_012762 [Dryococelus australis]|uniref:Uncharacterized protein n=1 Tax=Dryococelus australis TaxID=614101 RepID=A0ABQ9HR50_9NEOP|nr:hypothetical protein PR048_012762 [Dryococelus australis]